MVRGAAPGPLLPLSSRVIRLAEGLVSFTFLHTSDWHIGKPFAGFEPAKAAILRQERLEVIERLAAAARSAGARHILVAGDVFDATGLADKLVRETLARLAAHRDLGWVLLPGNHDPLQAGGLWDRANRLGLPGNVVVPSAPAPLALTSDAVVLPAPLRARTVTTDPTQWMDNAATPSGAARIGLAHGAVQGFGSEGAQSVPIAPARRQSAGLAYLALGDWHGCKQIGDSVWYSGTPEPDQFVENAPGFALAVRIEGERCAAVERVATGGFRWLRRSILCRGADDLSPLEAEIAALGADARRLLVDVTLAGRIGLAERLALDRRLETLEAQVFVLRVRTDGLADEPAAGDLAVVADPLLQRAAERLAILAADTGSAQGPLAARALRLLYAMVHDVKDGAP